MSSKEISVGLIGLDTSHAVAFSRMLNEPGNSSAIPGAKVTCGFPGGSPDFPLSINRVAGITGTLRDELGVKILDSPEAVAAACDVVFIESVDGRVHLRQFEQVLPFGKPVFIDKPLATSSRDAGEILRLAAAHKLPIMSCSSLRYAQFLREELVRSDETVLSCDLYGPLQEEATQPGWFWYGVHTMEMLVAILGPGFAEVECRNLGNHEIFRAVHTDGRVGVIHGMRNVHTQFGGVIHRASGAARFDASAGRPYYEELLRVILATLPEGMEPIPHAEMLEVIRLIEAANVSRAENRPVSL